MKFDCGPDWKEYKEKREAWHKWFAWRPIRLASHDCRWLEIVYRKGEYYYNWDGGRGWDWEYKSASGE